MPPVPTSDLSLSEAPAFVPPRLSVWLLTTSVARLAFGGILMSLGVVLFIPLLLLALPSRPLRVRISNVYGSIFGRAMFWCSGSTVHTTGHAEALARPPAIWAMNHCSLLDIPLGIWFSPSGTCGVGKRQVILYPFFGLLYVLAGHVRIDRGVSKRAIASLQRMAKFINDNRLSIFIWPEGTRSRDGRLQEVRKGIVHLAIQTGLPIQPMVTMGTQRAWPKGPPRVTPTDVHIVFPEPIDTTGWSADRIEEHLAAIEDAFIRNLSEDQQPLHPLRDQPQPRKLAS